MDEAMDKTGKQCVHIEDFDACIASKSIDYVQSAVWSGGKLTGFTIRFTDGALLKVDASKLQHSIDAMYLPPDYYESHEASAGG